MGSTPEETLAQEERAALVEEQAQPPVQDWRRRQRRGIAAAAVALGVAGTVMVRRAVSPCVAPPSAEGLEAVVQAYAADPVHAAIGQHAPKGAAVLEWLAAANAADSAIASGGGGAVKVGKMDLTRQAEDAIEQAMKSNDPMLAERLVHQAMNKAVIRNKGKRKEFLDYLKTASAGKSSKGSFLVAGPTPAPVSTKAPGPLAKALSSGAFAPTTKSPSEMEAEAYCTFDVLQIATTMASFAASINDVVKTCEGVGFDDLMVSTAEQTHAKVCSVNLAQMAGSMTSLATTSALAADDCAATMIPNLDALCSGAITATLTATAAFAGAFTLINAACTDKGWYARVPPGITPSNVGSNRIEKAGGTARRLEEVSEATPAPPRKLLFGGGKAALATQCATEAANIAWSLAALVMDIYDAAGTDGDGYCPPANFLTGTDRPRGLLYKLSVGLCNMKVSSALLDIFSIMIFAQLISVTCTDELNLGAICGSGVAGLLAGAAGISKAGTALWIACDVGQWPVLNHLVKLLRRVDQVSGNKLTDLIRSSNVTLGRRLDEEDDRVARLKAKYASPADVWKDLGFDLEDPDALWRKAHVEKSLRQGDLANFVHEESAGEHTYSALFGEPRTCSSA